MLGHTLGEALTAQHGIQDHTFRDLSMLFSQGLRPGTKWWHVGIHYFRPRRPTFIEVELLPIEVWGHKVVKPLYDSSGLAMCRTVHEAMLSLDFDQTYEVDLYRFVAFDKRLPGWKPDRLLTIAPMSEHISIPQTLRVWKGAALELKTFYENVAKAAAAAARRAAGSSGGAPRAKAPKTERRVFHQGKAARDAAANDPNHQALLAIQDAPSDLLLPADHESWAELFMDGADVSEDSDGDNLFGDDLSLDATLASLKHKEAAPSPLPRPSDLESVSSIDDLLGKASDSDGLADDKPIVFTVHKPKEKNEAPSSPDPDDIASPTSPASSRSTGSSSSSSSSKASEDGDAIGSDDSGAKRHSGKRGKCTLDKDDDAPAGCKLRKYEGAGLVPFWVGTLPDGIDDSEGKHTRRRSYREGLRTEGEALADIELWLHCAMDGVPKSPDV